MAPANTPNCSHTLTTLSQGVVVTLTSGQLMPLSAAPVLPSPAQAYRPTALFSVARMYWRSMHSSICC